MAHILASVTIQRESEDNEQETCAVGIHVRCDCPVCTQRNAAFLLAGVLLLVEHGQLDWDRLLQNAHMIHYNDATGKPRLN